MDLLTNETKEIIAYQEMITRLRNRIEDILKNYRPVMNGEILYEKAIEIANRKNSDYVWLGVWEENPRAISFYKKNGFVEFDKHIFRLGDDEQTDVMMKLNLQ